jgi:glycosyltransferase involved in cell wall biosynthesis
MENLIIITPVKDSLNTTKETIRSLRKANTHNIPYYIFDDYSSDDTRKWLMANQKKYDYKVIHLKDHTDSPSPNYKTTLKLAQKMALDKGAGLVIIESDVLATEEIIEKLNNLSKELPNTGLIGAVTVNNDGEINFPYTHIKEDMPDIITSKNSLSFCCTLLTNNFLRRFDFNDLSEKKHWYDVHISKGSLAMGFKNYVIKNAPVIHQPHSSRPWKHEKYSNPIRYYFKKFFLRRDKI